MAAHPAAGVLPDILRPQFVDVMPDAGALESGERYRAGVHPDYTFGIAEVILMHRRLSGGVV